MGAKICTLGEVRLAFLLVMLAAFGCGAQQGTSGEEYRPQPLEAHVFLRGYGQANVATFEEVRSVETLKPLVRETRGEERRAIHRELALAYLWEAESEAEERDARRNRRQAQKSAERASKRSRDDWLQAEMDFVALWAAWRAGARNADRKAERFTSRRLSSGDLLLLAWAIRGEIALEAERWEDARTAFRYLLGQIEHPLYAYALFREGEALRGLDRRDEAREAFEQARDMGCNPDAPPSVLRIAALASRQAGTPVHLDANRDPRPSSCAPPPSAEGEVAGDDEEWAPAE